MQKNVDLFEYFSPSQKIIDAVGNLEVFYQLTHQKEMEVYSKKGKDKYFSGTLGEYFRLKEIEELMEFEGKPWSCLLKAIFLLQEYTSNVDVKNINRLSANDTEQFVSIIKNGISSYDSVKEWVEPLSKKKGAVDAVYDAVKVNIGNQFKVLQLAKLKNYSKSRTSFLYNDILDIENPEALVYYLQHTKDETSDCLIVTIQRNKQHDFRGVFFLFLICNGYLYSIDNSSNRLNLDNTEGMRNPSRYLERQYDKVWLPIDLLFGEDIKRKVIIKGQKVFKIYTWDKIAKNNIGYLYWLNMFLFRVIDYISTTKILKGLTSKQSIPLLETGNKAIDFSYKTREQHGRNDYLLNKYKDKVTTKALVLKKEKLPPIIATKEHVQNIIAYKKRKLIADEIERELFKDFDENKKTVEKWIETFIKKLDAKELMIHALEKKKYTYIHYPQFTEKRKIASKKDTILRIAECTYSHIDHYNWFRLGRLIHNIGDRWTRDYYYYEDVCYFCHAKRKRSVLLDFIDYRQFLKFFNLKKKDIPIQMVKHLHQKRQMYIGNSILDDLDPVDGVCDPWFRGGDSAKETHRFMHTDPPKIEIVIPMCLRCLNKYQRMADQKKKLGGGD